MTPQPSDFAHVRFTLDAVIKAEGENHEYLAQRLNSAFGQAIGNGAITGDSAATVEEFSAKTTLLSTEAAALDEDDVTKWLASQIEDGNMDVERLPLLMARYALTDPAEMRSELAERMGLFEHDEHTQVSLLGTTEAETKGLDDVKTEPKRPDPKDSMLELNSFEEAAWLGFGNGARQIRLSREEQRVLLATTDEALSDLRRRVSEQIEVGTDERDAFILATRMASEGELEIDDDAGVSLGADNGAYVCMWKWVEFPKQADEAEQQKLAREGCR